jgi:hypothetical protein
MMEHHERDFKGIWIPREILALGLPEITRWVWLTYKVDLYAYNPLKGDEHRGTAI